MKTCKLGLLFMCVPFSICIQELQAGPIGRSYKQSTLSINPMPRNMSWKKALRTGGKSYIKPSLQIGAEILKGEKNSPIGTDEHVRLNQVSAFLRPLGPTVSRLISKQIVRPQQKFPANFDGYYTDFPKAWQKFKDHTHSKGGRLEVLLEAAYGDDPVFSGHFVATFDEISSLANQPVKHGASIHEAFMQALTQASEIKAGIFLICVAGNNRRPKDVILLDLANSRYISYNHSKANAWARVIGARNPSDEIDERSDTHLNDWKIDSTIIDRRATQGIILRINGDPNNPKDISVSLTGHSWTIYHLNAKTAHTSKELEQGLNIWEAWNKGYYILDDGYRCLFASGQGKPLFLTPREVDAYIKQQKQFEK